MVLQQPSTRPKQGQILQKRALIATCLVGGNCLSRNLVGEHLYCSTPFNPGTVSWLAELRNLLTLDAFARPSNRMLPIPKDNVRDKSFSLESWKENKKIYKKDSSGIGKESCSRL